jgi:hypothetical protein
MTARRRGRPEAAAPAPRGELRGVTFVDPRRGEALEIERWRREQRRIAFAKVLAGSNPKETTENEQ